MDSAQTSLASEYIGEGRYPREPASCLRMVGNEDETVADLLQRSSYTIQNPRPTHREETLGHSTIARCATAGENGASAGRDHDRAQ
jgi:hypothetical protein